MHLKLLPQHVLIWHYFAPEKKKTFNPTSAALIIIWRLIPRQIIWKKTKCDLKHEAQTRHKAPTCRVFVAAISLQSCFFFFFFTASKTKSRWGRSSSITVARTGGRCSRGARLKAWQTQMMTLPGDNRSSTVSGLTTVPWGQQVSRELLYSLYF